jgi:hypothetical protein
VDPAGHFYASVHPLCPTRVATWFPAQPISLILNNADLVDAQMDCHWINPHQSFALSFDQKKMKNFARLLQNSLTSHNRAVLGHQTYIVVFNEIGWHISAVIISAGVNSIFVPYFTPSILKLLYLLGFLLSLTVHLI